jgi:hypothetical protein
LATVLFVVCLLTTVLFVFFLSATLLFVIFSIDHCKKRQTIQ